MWVHPCWQLATCFTVSDTCLHVQVSDGGSVGWEELTEAGMTHLLASQLARSQHERSVQTTPLAQACDVHKLKKHISIVLERLSQGASLSAPPG